MKPRIPEIPSDLNLDQAEAEAEEAHRLSRELMDAILSLADLEAQAETESEAEQLAAERTEREAEQLAAELRTQAARLRLATARAESTEQEILRILINTPSTPPRQASFRPPVRARGRSRASRGCSSRTRGSRRTARSTGPPGGEDGDPDPSGLAARTGREQTKGRSIATAGGLS